MIENYAFSFSSIVKLKIPSQVTQIGEGAFDSCKKLEEIEFASDSKLKTIENKTFMDSSLERITIPSHVTRIGKSAFSCCHKLQVVEFASDSNLQMIENYAFNCSSIVKLKIPSQVTHIGEGAFYSCAKLEEIEFASDSKLKTIENKTFMDSSLERITISSHVTRIGIKAFSGCNKLHVIEFTSDSELQTIDEEAFESSSIENFTIPPKLIELKKGWCKETNNLIEINVSQKNPFFKSYENKLIIRKSSINYDSLVFCFRNVELLTIPSFIKKIDQYAFTGCNQLRSIEFTSDSELQIIDSFAFYNSSIMFFTIPPKLSEIKENWCYRAKKLDKIKVSLNNPYFKEYDDKIIIEKSSIDKENYDQLIFCNKDVKTITIPSFIEHISPIAFSFCDKLQQIEFPSDSKLQEIEYNTFFYTEIECIKIPSQVT